MSEKEDSEIYENFKQNIDIQKINKEIEELSVHPLFLNDQEKVNECNNEHIEALRSLIYDESPETIA